MGIISFSFMWCKDIQNKECNTLKIKSYVQEVFKIKPIVIKTKCRYLEAYEHDDSCLECKGTGEQEIEIYALRGFEKKLKILVACEESQRVCIAFRKLGHEAYSCDVLPCSGGHPEWH